MSENTSVWNSAGKAGLVLGAISITYFLVTNLISNHMPDGTLMIILINILTMLLWVIKFTGCIYAMKYFMKNYCVENQDADNSSVFRFGTVTALYSALLYSAFSLAYTLFIAPDTYAKAFDAVRDMPTMDSATLEVIDQMIPMMPTYSFFTILLYCWLFGTILSAILSRNIPSSNPFGSDFDNLEQ